jgi:hypothetical protein
MPTITTTTISSQQAEAAGAAERAPAGRRAAYCQEPTSASFPSPPGWPSAAQS